MHGLNMIGRHARIESRLPQLATRLLCVQLNNSITFVF